MDSNRLDSPSKLRGFRGTPPNVTKPMEVWRADLATLTRLAVRAEQTAAQRNCEKVSTVPHTITKPKEI